MVFPRIWLCGLTLLLMIRPLGAEGGKLPPKLDEKDPRLEYFPMLRHRATYVGNDRCLSCHQDADHADPRGLHRRYLDPDKVPEPERRGCEGCHGPGSIHAAGTWPAITNPGRLAPRALTALCTSCHEVRTRIGYAEDHYSGHASRGVACLSCHKGHKPADGDHFLRHEPNRLCAGCHASVASQFSLRSRHPLKMEGVHPTFSVREGKVRCIDCHEGKSVLEDLPRSDPGAGKCLECHPNTRGPFLFPHDAGGREVSDGCITCHLPHGSPNRHLLRATDRGLCITCHNDQIVGHFPGPSCTTMGCHSEIHGSNTNFFLLGN